MTYRAGFTYIHAFFLIPNLLFSGLGICVDTGLAVVCSESLIRTCGTSTVVVSLNPQVWYIRDQIGSELNAEHSRIVIDVDNVSTYHSTFLAILVYSVDAGSKHRQLFKSVERNGDASPYKKNTP